MTPIALEVPDITYPSIQVLNKSATYSDFRDELQQNGYAVLKNVIPQDRALHYRQKAFDWLNSFETKFDLDKPETWIAKNLPAMNKVRMFHAYGVVHEKFMWDKMTYICFLEKSWNGSRSVAGKNIRTAIYATYMPASLASADQLAKKKTVFERFECTTHWPHEHIEPNAARAKPVLSDGTIDPRAENRKEPIEKPNYSDKLLRLAVVLPY
ncbi:hypothetical protein N7507_008035 [Penicillium longicatenatum]|nr:hypothetical protein N7507_008035 [Penicillium longicatenatum]